MIYKGVVFDFNGTLVWDTPYHNQAFDIFLEKHNIQLTDDDMKDLHFAYGVVELFDFLKQHEIPFTIATSSDFFNVDFYFREMNLARWFTPENVVYNDGTLKGKPEPDIFLRAAARLKLSPSELVIFEDSKAGILAAERAGAGKIYIVDSIKDDDLKAFGHEIINHFDEVNKKLFKDDI